MITKESGSGSGFWFGAIIGAVTGVLFARKAGYETRQQLVEWWSGLSEQSEIEGEKGRGMGLGSQRETSKSGKESKSSWGYQEAGEGARPYQKSVKDQ